MFTADWVKFEILKTYGSINPDTEDCWYEECFMAEVCEILKEQYNINAEPSSQMGIGTDFFFRNGDELGTIDLEYELELMTEIINNSIDFNTAIDRATIKLLNTINY